MNSAPPEIMKIPPYIDVPGMKRLFSLGKYKTYSLLNTGQIKRYRDGKAWIISTASVLAHLKKIDPKIPNVMEA